MIDYPPGTVADATVVGCRHMRVFRTHDPLPFWVTTGGTEHRDEDVTDIGPLLVLDPADEAQMWRLADEFCKARWCHTSNGDTDLCDPLTRSSMKEAVTALLTPPKPAEPTGIGAVVVTARNEQWVRVWNHLVEGRVWTQGLVLDGSHIFRAYEDIPAVRVLSEGVTTE